MKNVAEISGRRGWLALIGGGEDKHRDRQVLQRIVSINDAQNIVIIPTASRVGDEVGAEYDDAFDALGVPNRIVLDITRGSEAARRQDLDAIDQADLIFFTGGDQVRLVDVLSDTPLLKRVRRRLIDGATVAGTSAGAAAAGQYMLYDGDGRGFVKGSIGSSEGFGFLPGVTIDTHFVSRGRIGRLAQFLCGGDSARGFGLCEDTGLLISPEDVAIVIGSDMVTALNYRQVDHNDYAEIDQGDLFTVDGVRLSFLAPGTHFDLQGWRCVKKAKATVTSLRAGKKSSILVS